MKKILVLQFLTLALLLFICACNAPPTDVPPTSTSVPQPGLRNLVNGTITVKPGNFYDIQFSLDKSVREGAVSGYFNVQGEAFNNIEVLIMNDTDFGEWKNAHQENCVFNSGRVNSANISVSGLTPNAYHLVFDNSPSLLTPKQVFTVIDLTWTRYPPGSF